MTRRIVLAAGIAAAVLDVGALLLLLLAPLLPVCNIKGLASCPVSSVRYVPLLQAGVSTAGLVYVFSLFVFILAAAVGALAEARMGARWGAWVLWAAGVLAFAACALGAGGVGLVYLPAVLAVCLAAYTSVSGPLRALHRGQPGGDAAANPPISQRNRPTS